MPSNNRLQNAAGAGDENRASHTPPDTDATSTGLISVDDLEPPKWASVDEQVAAASMLRTLRAMPAAIVVVARLAWSVVPRLTTIAVVVHLVSGCVTAFGCSRLRT